MLKKQPPKATRRSSPPWPPVLPALLHGTVHQDAVLPPHHPLRGGGAELRKLHTHGRGHGERVKES
ncbi:hypothetical protein AV541_04830 [Thermus parvatiensis]|uniref:Uncharacterized protein n=1 Tax=Thermus parvatiensis TaxID=456163 RepID=A0A120HT67_9DEIN|nr:hypothetical protein AV541_04830 [Thermus parvatiensis]